MSLLHSIVSLDPVGLSNNVDKKVAYIPGQSIFVYAKNHLNSLGIIGDDFCVVYNGNVFYPEQTKSIIPYPQESFVTIPDIDGGGNRGNSKVLSTIVTIAMMYIAPWAGTQATAASTGMTASQVVSAGGMAAWNAAGYGAAFLVMAAGSALVSYLNPAPKQEKGASPTYGWGGIQPIVGQGQPFPIILGKERVAGIPVSKNVTTIGDKQYYNLLVCLGEGPCDYVGNGEDDNCTGITNICINGNPIENFNGIRVFKRAGLNNQSVIPNFIQNTVDQPIGVELLDDSQWHTFTTNDDSGSGLTLLVACPNGLFHTAESGRMTNSVYLEFRYRLLGDTEWINYNAVKSVPIRRIDNDHFEVQGDRTQLFPDGKDIWFDVGGVTYLAQSGGAFPYTYKNISQYEQVITSTTVYVKGIYIPRNVQYVYWNDPYEISAKTSTPINRVITINTGVTGKYEVGCRCTFIAYTNNTKDAHTVVWATLSHVAYDRFSRPNEILVSVQALANDQVSGGEPILTMDVQRSNVPVFVPDNPVTDPYGAGSYQLKSATNPGWQSYWINHRVSHLYNINTSEWEYIVRGAPIQRMDYNDFKGWADFCDARDIKCNIYLDTKNMTVREALEPIEEIGRGKVRQKGTRIGCFWDKPALKDVSNRIIPTHSYNSETIGKNSFSEKWTDTTERATAIEVRFRDSNNGYNWTPLVVPADGYNNDQAKAKITTLDLPGCTSSDVAWKHGKWRLFQNRSLNNSISIVENINAIDSDLSEVISIQHPVPGWGIGGRVVSLNGDLVTLNKPVKMEAGKQYEVKFILNDDTQIVRSVILEEGETTRIQVGEIFVNDTVEALYESLNTFSVEGDKTSDFIVGQLVEIYHGTGDITSYIQNTTLNEEFNKTVVTVDNCPEDIDSVRFAWTMPHELDFFNFGEVRDEIPVYEKPYRVVGFTKYSDLIYQINAINYVEFNEATDSPTINYSTIETGFDVENLNVKEETTRQKDGTIISNLNFSWTYPEGKLPDKCLIYYSNDFTDTWVFIGETFGTKHTLYNVTPGQFYNVKVCVVSGVFTTHGVISDSVYIVGKDTPPGDIVEFNVIQVESNLRITVVEPDDSDIDHSEIRTGPTWENSEFFETVPKGQSNITKEITQEGTQTFHIKAFDRSKNESTNAKSVTVPIFALSTRNVITTRVDTTDSWTEMIGMYRCPYNPSCLKIESIQKIGDNQFFSSMFANGYTLRTDAEVIIPEVDLGPNVIEEDCFYYDDQGIIRLNTVKKIQDYPTFFAIFNEPWEHIIPQFRLTTSAYLTVNYDKKSQNYITTYSRTSFDGITFGDWTLLSNHNFFGRYWQAKLKPISQDGLTNVYICGATTQIDVPDMMEKIPITPVEAVGATRVYLQKRFYATDKPEIISLDNNGKTCIWELVGNQVHQDATGKWYFDIKLWNLAGNVQIAGTIYGTQRGY